MTKLLFGETYKSFIQVSLIEGSIVGLLLVILFSLISFLLRNNNLIKNKNIQLYLSLFISGALFHILCEYTGVNVWYVKNYKELLPKI
jgi:hypothetical protein